MEQFKYNIELNTAWRLWHQLQELSDLLWEYYEEEFINRHLLEEEQEQLRSDSHDHDYPF